MWEWLNVPLDIESRCPVSYIYLAFLSQGRWKIPAPTLFPGKGALQTCHPHKQGSKPPPVPPHRGTSQALLRRGPHLSRAKPGISIHTPTGPLVIGMWAHNRKTKHQNNSLL